MTNMISFLHMDFEFTDERGWLRQLTHDTWKQVYVSQTKAGEFRGKHYHAHNREAFYIISGEIEIFLEKDGEQRHLTVKNNDFFAIEPGTVHTFTFNQDTLMVIMYDKGIEEANGIKDIYSQVQNEKD